MYVTFIFHEENRQKWNNLPEFPEWQTVNCDLNPNSSAPDPSSQPSPWIFGFWLHIYKKTTFYMLIFAIISEANIVLILPFMKLQFKEEFTQLAWSFIHQACSQMCRAWCIRTLASLYLKQVNRISGKEAK